jgi:hypothetical protein
LFAPVVWAVRYFGIEIAWWVKDTIMAYALLGAAHARAYQVMLRRGLEKIDYEGDYDEFPLAALVLPFAHTLRLARHIVLCPKSPGSYFENWCWQ